MQLHELKAPLGARKRRKIVGRGGGSGHGGTSGRGDKGQNARGSGRKLVMALEGGQVPLIRRLPKVGFRSRRPILNQIVDLDGLNQLDNGTVVDAGVLKSKGLIKSLRKPFKILGEGDLQKALTIQEGSVSKTAREKILQAGGTIHSGEENPDTAKDSKKKNKTPA